MTTRRAMGWLPDYPDFRDYTVRTSTVGPWFQRLGETRSVADMLSSIGIARDPPASADLRAHCSPVEDQGEIGSCTAHAGMGMLEYYGRRVHGRHLAASRLSLPSSLLYLPASTRHLAALSRHDAALPRRARPRTRPAVRLDYAPWRRAQRGRWQRVTQRDKNRAMTRISSTYE